MHLGALTDIEADALTAILARRRAGRCGKKTRSQLRLLAYWRAQLTSTIRHFGQAGFGVEPLTIAALDVGDAAAIWKLKAAHAFGMAKAAYIIDMH